jgi:hypothetical protein
MPRMPSGSSTKPSFLYSPTTCSEPGGTIGDSHELVIEWSRTSIYPIKI